MKNLYLFHSKKILFLFFLLTATLGLIAQEDDSVNSVEFSEYSGIVVDGKTGDPLVFASITISGTNISTISNTDGEFLLKVPKSELGAKINVSFLGYMHKTIAIANLKTVKNRIELIATATQLSEINVKLPTNA